jgi:ACS family tartrate transporter-like MFS transporter
MPFMMLLYLVNYIDRVNVGFAALTMNEALGFTPSIFGYGAGAFFISYALFQMPANAILTKIGARRWIFTIVLAWGAISASCALVQGPLSFYALRFLLGLAEAGFFPGMIFYLVLWFPSEYRARLIALFMSAAPLSFIIGGPLSSLILQMDGTFGLAGWQWLFVIEGIPACLLALLVPVLLPDNPQSAKWLTQDEKTEIARRLSKDNGTEESEFWLVLKNPTVLALGIANFGYAAGHYGAQLWLPQIVQGMGYSTLATGFVTVIPFALAMAAMIYWGRLSDAKGERFAHAGFAIGLAAAGFIAASVSGVEIFVLLGLTVALIGIQAGFGPFYSLPATLLKGPQAAAGVAFVQTIGLTGGFVGSALIGVIKEQTGAYAMGMAVLAFILFASAFVVVMVGRALTARAPSGKIFSPN